MANMPAPIIQTPTQPSNANITGGTINGQPVANMPTTAEAAALAVVTTSLANGASGTFGNDLQDWSLPNLACDTQGGFRLVVNGVAKGTTGHTLGLAVNGSTANLLNSYYYNVAAGNQPIPYGVSTGTMGTINGNSQGVDGTPWILILECPAPVSGSGQRQFFWSLNSLNSPANSANLFSAWGTLTWAGTGEITAVGLHSSVAATMAAASKYTLTRL
jgi:hypothetical protein